MKRIIPLLFLIFFCTPALINAEGLRLSPAKITLNSPVPIGVKTHLQTYTVYNDSDQEKVVSIETGSGIFSDKEKVLIPPGNTDTFSVYAILDSKDASSEPSTKKVTVRTNSGDYSGIRLIASITLETEQLLFHEKILLFLVTHKLKVIPITALGYLILLLLKRKKTKHT
ncbi:hypothetical protein IMZ31_22610 (plasmid) [Pontibacillus sp. ALD_SL1]|uniref:hypothetical protein n=1 Tax=Pontibacillus sp. ALD_SL1 TaxID=2777185 RepID=UPI001A9622BB|nr:hypothetical protein [Pontibacillus sp. ALD_SL1]QST02249.1 hypothetical protein IMZ31_22610 [Pontibacillus sp. ALD_SL1]